MALRFGQFACVFVLALIASSADSIFSMRAFSLSPDSNNLVIGTIGEPSNLNPWTGNERAKEDTMSLLYLGLTFVNSQGDVNPGLATMLPTEENGRVLFESDSDGNFISQRVDWTIHPGATWSDGVDINCADVVFTFEVQSRTDLPVSTRAFSNRIESVECTNGDDGDDFTITYNQPNIFYSGTEGRIGLARFGDIAPKHIWESVLSSISTPEDFLNAAPAQGIDPFLVVGSGAYQLLEWNFNQFMTLKRRYSFFMNPENVDNYVQELTIRYLYDQPTLISALIFGEIDATDDISLSGLYLPDLQSELGSATEIHVTPYSFIEKLNLNLFTDSNGIGGLYPDQVDCQESDDLMLWDKRTRQAIIQAVDRETLGQTVFPGAIVSNSFVIGGSSAFNNELSTWPYNPEAARALLDSLGWNDSDGNGILDRTTNDGRQIEFILSWVSATEENRILTGIILQQELQEVGIYLEIENLPSSVIFSNEYLNHDSECVFSGIIEYAERGGLNEPYDPLTSELLCNDVLNQADFEQPNTPLASNGFAGYNITGWCNSEFDELYGYASSEFDQSARDHLLMQMQVIYNEELPTIPLYEMPGIFAKEMDLVNYGNELARARTSHFEPWNYGWASNGAQFTAKWWRRIFTLSSMITSDNVSYSFTPPNLADVRFQFDDVPTSEDPAQWLSIYITNKSTRAAGSLSITIQTVGGPRTFQFQVPSGCVPSFPCN